MHVPLVRRLPALLLALALPACAPSDAVGPEAGPPLQTDSLVYHARVVDGELALEVGFTYFNRTGSRVFVPACGEVHPPELEKWTGSAWQVAHSPLISRCLAEPVVVPRGGSYRSTYRLPGGIRVAGLGEPIEGRYRLAWRLYRSWSSGAEARPGEPLPEEAGVSNEFRVER